MHRSFPSRAQTARALCRPARRSAPGQAVWRMVLGASTKLCSPPVLDAVAGRACRPEWAPDRPAVPGVQELPHLPVLRGCVLYGRRPRGRSVLWIGPLGVLGACLCSSPGEVRCDCAKEMSRRSRPARMNSPTWQYNTVAVRLPGLPFVICIFRRVPTWHRVPTWRFLFLIPVHSYRLGGNNSHTHELQVRSVIHHGQQHLPRPPQDRRYVHRLNHLESAWLSAQAAGTSPLLLDPLQSLVSSIVIPDTIPVANLHQQPALLRSPPPRRPR